MSITIGNRRFTGSKKTLLSFIYESVEPYLRKGFVFADLFAGTGVVSAYMLENNFDVIMNDLLYSNYVTYEAWFGNGVYNKKKIEKFINEFNLIDPLSLKKNYFSNIYGNKYFSVNDSKKIGYIRDKIDVLNLTKREKYILISSLMYAADRISNTVGHYEHYLSKQPKDRGVFLKFPKITKYKGKTRIYNLDANELVKKIKCDIAYIDPPYNARQYINFYHVLENLAKWDKPTEFEGKSMKFKRNHLKSEYSKKCAPQVFEELVNNINAKFIVLSYNNTYSAKSTSSNNKISEDQIIDILKKKGEVLKKEIKHKSFNSGQTNFLDHKEFLFICKVKK